MDNNEIEFTLTKDYFKDINLDDYNDEISETNTSYYNSSTESDNQNNNNSDCDSNSNSDKNITNKYIPDYSEESYITDSDTSTYTNESSTHSEDLFSSKINGNEFHGEVLKNRYLIIKKLGYGSFSSVWMAYDIETKKLVAIKIINPDDIKEGILEIKIFEKLKKLENTYLLTMLDYFQVKAIHYKYYELDSDNDDTNNLFHIIIVLPLMACSAYDLLECKQYKDGLPYKLSLKIIEQTILAIKELEDNNLIHTDIKPENILICGLNKEAEIILKLIESININNYLKIDLQNTDDLWKTTYRCYKKITFGIIHFMKKKFDEIKEQMKECKVSSEYLTNIHIKLCDFNLVLDINKNLNKAVQIQTRYYRAPEIILGAGLHKKSDYWSIGCTLFELLTGDLLFDPKKNNYNRDMNHIFLIQELLGIIPKELFDKAKFYNNIYDKKELRNINKWELSNVFKDNYDNLGLNNKIITAITKFINMTLIIDPKNRSSLDELLHFIKNIYILDPDGNI